MERFEGTLPIGSVVLLKNGTKRVMILGYLRYRAGDQTRIYDYCGCTYPEGFISPEKQRYLTIQILHRFIRWGIRMHSRLRFARNCQKLETRKRMHKKY